MARLLDFLCSEAVEPPSLRLSKRSRFLDIGSGIGQAVLHVQLQFALASATGIEYVWDRWNASEETLRSLCGDTPSFDVASLRPALDERLERVHFIHGRIEEHVSLLNEATHVFMFDAAFHPHTHKVLLPLLCSGEPRIVITCLSLEKMRQVCPEIEEPSRLFRLLTSLSLTMAGSGTSRMAYVYATQRC